LISVVLAIVSSTLIGVVFKLSELRVSNSFLMLAANYFIATSISVILWKSQQSPVDISTGSIVLAVVAGAIFAGNFFLMSHAVKNFGVGLPVILMRLSAIVPIAASILFFGEDPAVNQYVGFTGALIAAAMLSVSMKGGIRNISIGENKFSLVVSSFLLLFCFGTADLSLKIFDITADQNSKSLFLTILFAVAFSTMLAAALISKAKFKLNDLFWGMALGIPNMLSAFFMMSALKELPAFVVFPLVSVGTVLLITAIAIKFFKEKLSLMGFLAIILTIISIWQINQ